MGWFTRKRRRQTEPQADRYDGKPLLILLDNYVLGCVAELPPGREAQLVNASQRVWGGSDDWRATLRARLHISDTVDEDLRRLWVRNQEIARLANATLSPEEFVHMIVDKNFAHLLEH